MPKNPAQQLIDSGLSVWYDNIGRELLESGELKSLISTFGVRGVTSNPTIFDKATSSTNLYDADIADMKKRGVQLEKMFDELAVKDIAAAADILRPVYDASGGDDGFVSIEVSPLLASDTAGTIEEGYRLYESLNRPNIMVKVPGTEKGIPAVRALLERGVNVNITLLFSVENYTAVANTYCEALRARAARNEPIDKIRSVASFFVSRVDSIVDGELDKIINGDDPERGRKAKSLRGKFGIANCKLAYKRFQEIFNGDSFSDLRSKGAAVQRPLWASTGTKDPKYRDTLYVEELIGPDSVNTMPDATLKAFADHGVVATTVTKNVEEAETVRKDLLALGVDVDAALIELQVDGVNKFTDSFKALNKTIAGKL